MRWRAAFLLGFGAIGCSLLVPLDYTGGKESSPTGKAGREAGGTGGIPGEGGTLSEGGSGDIGGAPEGGAETGGTGLVSMTGGVSGSGGDGGSTAAMGGTADVGGSGGTGGDVAGGGGTAGMGGSTGGEGAMGGAGGDVAGGGMGGAGLGGMGGRAVGGRGGRAAGGHAGAGAGGMSAGMAGMAAGMGGCPFDLQTNPDHCGSCTNACDDGIDCENGVCVTSPCAGLCASWSVVPLIASDGYRADPIAKTEGCFEVETYMPTENDPAIVCWNFNNGRVLQVNGTVMPCTLGAGEPLTLPVRAGGYCIQAGVSNECCSGFILPM